MVKKINILLASCALGLSTTSSALVVPIAVVRTHTSLACEADFKKEIKCRQILRKRTETYALKLCRDVKSYAEKAALTSYDSACKKKWRKLTCYSSFAADCT